MGKAVPSYLRGKQARPKRVEIDGYTFASQAEARRYGELKLLEKAGEIRDLVVHPRLHLNIKGKDLGEVELDFSYFVKNEKIGNCWFWVQKYEDVKRKDSKGRYVHTPLSKFRHRVAEALHGIKIEIVLR